MKKILIIRFSSLGDIVLSTPLIPLLQQHFPQAKLFFAVKESFAPILPPQVEKIVFKTNDSLFNFIKKIVPLSPFDLVIDLQSNLNSRILCSTLAKDKLARFRKPYLRRLLTILTKKNFLSTVPSVPQRYLNSLQGILPEIPEAATLRPLLAREELPLKVSQYLKDKTYFILAPGARHFTKKWPLEYFLNLAQQIHLKKRNYLVVLLGSAHEAQDCQYLAKHLQATSLVLAGELSLPQVVSLIDNARFIVCNDSGLMHVAAFTQTPIYACFTSTIPEFGFAPLSPYAKILMAKEIPCRPCNHKGLAKCPRGDYICGKLLTPEIVLQAIQL